MQSPIPASASTLPQSAMELQRVRSNEPFLLNYQPSELRIASEFFTTWLPFLSRDLCPHCTQILSDRIRSIDPESHGDAHEEQFGQDLNASDSKDMQSHETSEIHDDNCDANSEGSPKDGAEANHSGEVSGSSESEPVIETSTTEVGATESEPLPEISTSEVGASESEPLPEISSSEVGASVAEPVPETSTSEVACDCNSPSIGTSSPRVSWADIAQEDEFGDEENESNKQPTNSNPSAVMTSEIPEKPKLSREQREYIRFMNVRRKKDFACYERVNGKLVNVLEGLELHTGIFSAAEQKRIVNYVTSLQEIGKRGELKERTYSAPQKWMRGKGRQTIQFGCCYNYAVDKDGNPPGILRKAAVDPLPHLFKVIIQRLIRWHVLPPTCVPDSCIVNIYEEGDCIPPHIDNQEFVRPFCTISFLSECDVLFGSKFRIVGPGEFDGSVAIPLPVGSVLVLNGNGADVAKHCVPAVPTKRISITFRRMEVSKRPEGYVPEPDLQGIQPLVYEVDREKRSNGPKQNDFVKRHRDRRENGNGMDRSDRHLEPRWVTHGPRRPESRWNGVKRRT